MAMLRVTCVILLFGLSGLSLTDATKGIDLSTLVYSNDFKCLKDDGYEFVIVRGYRSTGEPDPDAIHTIANARDAGFEYIDVYMFPCPKCGKSASEQVKEMVSALNISYGQIWLDIEGAQYWSGDKETNQRFFEDLLSEASLHKRTGVYASQYQWSTIMGDSYTGGGSHQLWYAHYDNNPSFSDFSPFGGWSKPAIKQYSADRSICGAGVDLNYY